MVPGDDGPHVDESGDPPARGKVWVLKCPVCDLGFLEPLMTESGRVVLLCDNAGEAWLRPSDVSFGTEIWVGPRGWEVGEGVHIKPGTTRWATSEEIPEDWWDAIPEG